MNIILGRTICFVRDFCECVPISTQHEESLFLCYENNSIRIVINFFSSESLSVRKEKALNAVYRVIPTFLGFYDKIVSQLVVTSISIQIYYLLISGLLYVTVLSDTILIMVVPNRIHIQWQEISLVHIIPFAINRILVVQNYV